MGYQLVISTAVADEVSFTVQADTGHPHGWVTLTDWTSTAGDPQAGLDLTDQLISDQAEAHGWTLTGPAHHDPPTMTVPVTPADWRTALTDTTRRRIAKQTEAEAADLAWRTLVADTPRHGDNGYVSAIDIAALAGVTRHRVYQLQGVGKKPGFQPATTS